MSKEKLINTTVRGDSAKRLQQLLLDYHYHRLAVATHPLRDELDYLGDWQMTRLKRTHHDLYHDPRYHEALDFLLRDLYAPKEFGQRDDDVERIFPVVVKLLPDHALYTVASLVELNLLSQQLDLFLTEVLFNQLQIHEITEQAYIEAYRRCNNLNLRLHQIQLIANIGNDLEKYVHSRLLLTTLKMTRKPAEMAGLGQLHSFLQRGFNAFRQIGDVNLLLDCVIQRETGILERIFADHPLPFELTETEQKGPARANAWQAS